jgi:hypothetical protein
MKWVLLALVLWRSPALASKADLSYVMTEVSRSPDHRWKVVSISVTALTDLSRTPQTFDQLGDPMMMDQLGSSWLRGVGNYVLPGSLSASAQDIYKSHRSITRPYDRILDSAWADNSAYFAFTSSDARNAKDWPIHGAVIKVRTATVVDVLEKLPHHYIDDPTVTFDGDALSFYERTETDDEGEGALSYMTYSLNILFQEAKAKSKAHKRGDP